MDARETLITLGISLGLGLLVGMQRERRAEELAGIRTFALLTLTGTLAALVGQQFGNAGVWIIASGVLAVGGIVTVGTLNKARINREDIGLTTEFAALIMYGVGAYLADKDHWLIGIVLGGVVVLLLHWKTVLHGFVRRMGDKDVSAIMVFVLIALVILPVLPNAHFGPYGFFNPFKTWLMVVLVVGISLGAYVVYKLVPSKAGAMLGGALGGLISSTATTMSYARQSKKQPQMTALAVQAIMTANTVSILRVIVWLAIFTQEKAPLLIVPLAAMAGTMAALAAGAYWFQRHAQATLPEQENPTELKTAIFFAGIYSLVNLATAWAKAAVGVTALYVVGGISGLTDMDAITLSLSDSARNQSVAEGVIWRVLLVAILANLAFKGACVMVLGSVQLKQHVGLLFGIAMAAGLGILFLWPG